jgi:hypothetical protein
LTNRFETWYWEIETDELRADPGASPRSALLLNLGKSGLRVTDDGACAGVIEV